MNLKFRCLTLVIIIIFSFSATAKPDQATEIKQPEVQSEAVFLVEQRNGQPLWEKNADQKRAIASTTKIMTALLVLEKLGIRENVMISPVAAQVRSDRISYKPGEQRSAEEMLYSLLLLSANNSAAALAEKIGRSEAGFVEMMNLKAAQMGAVNSVFANPHGLPSDQPNYSTARDLAVIATQAMKHPIFRRIVNSRDHDFIIGGRPPKRMENINELLKNYRYATGIKTGYTSAAGYCLVASAKRGGLSLIAVILGSKSREQSFADAKALFEYGFNNFAFRQIATKNRAYAKISLPKGSRKKLSLVAGSDIFILVYDKPATIIYRPQIKTGLRLPIKKGERLGKLNISQYGKNIGQVDLLAAETVNEKPVSLDRRAGVLKRLRSLLGLFGL